MAQRRRKVPKKVIEKPKEKTTIDWLIEHAEEEQERKRNVANEQKKQLVRAFVERTKSFFNLNNENAKSIEVYETDDGSLYVSYDGIDLFPVNEKSIYLVHDCPDCGEKTTLAGRISSWVALGMALKRIREDDIEVSDEHVCQRPSK